MNTEYYQDDPPPHHHHAHHHEGSSELNRADFVSDAEFGRMVDSGSLGMRREEFESHHQVFGEPSYEERPSHHSNFSIPEPQIEYDAYPRGHGADRPGLLMPEPIGVTAQPPSGYGSSEYEQRGEGYVGGGYGDGRGYSQGYGRQDHPQHVYSHIPSLASSYSSSSPEDTELFHQAAQRLSQSHPHTHPTTNQSYGHNEENRSQSQNQKYGYEQDGSELEHQTLQRHGYAQEYYDAPEGDAYEDHFKAHAMAYRPSSHTNNHQMDSNTIGQAAAIEALKMSAQQNQNKPPQGHGNTGGASHPSPAGGTQPQDKLIALAMAQAGKLFDEKHGGGAGSGNNEAKVQAMHSAAATIMHLVQSYKSTGKVDLQPGEMQGLIKAAMALF